jgi:hypothetical protein
MKSVRTSSTRMFGSRRALVVVLAFVIVVALVLAMSARSRPAAGAIVVGREQPVTANVLAQPQAHNSPQIAIDPTEPRFVAVANRIDAPDFNCALHVSGDGGRTWIPARPVPTLPAGADECYAPEIAFDGGGTLYYLFVGLQGRGNEPVGAFITSSTDRGRTFTEPRRVLGPENYQVRMAVDPDVGNEGRIHVVWLNASADAPLGGLPPPPNPILAMYSDDGGKTFSDPVQVSDPDRPHAVAPAIALGEDGVLHVVYYDLKDDARDYHGLEGPRWHGTWSLIATASADRGNTFARGVVVDDQLVPSERVMLIFTMRPASLAAGGDGDVFVAWDDARNGDRDAFVARSIDAGASWSEPRRLNDDETDRDQYLPRVSVALNGRVDAIFYDRRDDPANVFNHVYYTHSADGGETFQRNVRITSEAFDSRIGQTYRVPSAEGLIEFGGRLALASFEERVVAAWTDTRNGTFGGAQQDVVSVEIRHDESSSWLGLFVVGLLSRTAVWRRTLRDLTASAIQAQTDRSQGGAG